jgi:hypothetical protein
VLSCGFEANGLDERVEIIDNAVVEAIELRALLVIDFGISADRAKKTCGQRGVPPSNDLVLVSGIPPIRAHKARYYEDARINSRVLPPPALTATSADASGDRPAAHADDWTNLSLPEPGAAVAGGSVADSVADEDPANGGIRREPALPEHEAIATSLASSSVSPRPRRGMTSDPLGAGSFSTTSCTSLDERSRTPRIYSRPRSSRLAMVSGMIAPDQQLHRPNPKRRS